MKTVPFGINPAGIRQLITRTVQVTGIVPVRISAGPITYAEPEPAHFQAGLYQYCEVRPYLILGDPTVPGGFITLRYLPQSVLTGPADDWKCTVAMVAGTAESVAIQNGQIVVTLNTGVSTYASVYATLIANAYFAANIVAVLDGAGGIAATAQAVQSFVMPADTPVEITNGGLFRFGENYVELLGIHVELGVGSVITISVTDSDGVSHPRVLNTGVTGVAAYYPYPALAPIVVLPNQCVTVVETVNGVPVALPKCITLYGVTAQKR